MFNISGEYGEYKLEQKDDGEMHICKITLQDFDMTGMYRYATVNSCEEVSSFRCIRGVTLSCIEPLAR